MSKTSAKVDFRQFTKLTKLFERFEKKELQEFSVKLIKDLAARLLAKVVERTPAISGHLRLGWTIGNVSKEGNTYSVEVINTVAYALYVEKGHRIMGGEGRREMVRWREGVFMLKISEDELKKDIERIVENKLSKFIKEHFRVFEE